MKVLVYFNENNLESFEGVRMRKTIKGALEVSSVAHTGALLDSFDIAHFMSPDDEIRIHHVIERKKPLIVSALYSEDDKNASYLEYKLKFGNSLVETFKPKSLRLLNSANVVLVPNSSCRDYLINHGVTSQIKVVLPGVNFSRFNFSRDDEKEIFNRYFRRNADKRMIIGIGDHVRNIAGLVAFIKIAKANPDVDFYYICPSINEKDLRRRAIIRGVKCPKNCKTINLLSDDLYRSALMNASAIVFPGYNPVGACLLVDAMAARCQIIVRNSKLFNPIIEHNVSGYIAQNDEDFVKMVSDYLKGLIQPTTDKAYDLISSRTLDKYGEDLIKIYNEQISLKSK